MTTGNSNMTTASVAEATSPLLLIVLVTAIAAVVGWLCFGSDESVPIGTSEPPPLRLKGPTCSQQGESAGRAAKQDLLNAGSQWERAVFEPRLTALAVRNAWHAASCFGAAGLKQQARAAENIAMGYAREANLDYDRQRLRLKVALGRRDVDSAQRAIERLRALLESDDGEYLRGLARVERQLKTGASAP